MLRAMLVVGASHLAMAESLGHPEGTTAAEVSRHEEILDSIMGNSNYVA
ncbi:hypothetical protein [Sinomonas sp. ASV322]|nr:hypothetical protein [Sinomonas sp. ASV322]MDQ4502204.1 hypothetical protein [Sinomonas sp. ASV322]